MGQNIRIKDLWTPPQTPPLFCFLTPNFYVDDFYIILMFYFRMCIDCQDDVTSWLHNVILSMGQSECQSKCGSW